jgi:predicted dehydrogenase
MEFIHSGGIGKVHAVNCYYFSQRGSIGTGKPAEVPAHIDYERWQGPAPRQPYVDNRVHYNWHWFWHYGNGELGNNGIHTLDMARWALQAEFPTRVTSTGDRYYFDDDQQTPDTNTVSYEFGDKGHVTWFGNSCNRNGDGFVTVYGDKGSIEFHSGGGYTIKDRSNKEVKTASSGQGQAEHVDNLVKSIQAGDSSKLNAEIEIGHRSTLLCHLGNIAHRVGRVVDCDVKTGRVLGDKEAAALWKREYHEGWEERLTIG